jgi:hypothetical protein
VEKPREQAGMSVYLIANIQVRPASFAKFTAVMSKIVAIAEAAGWKLASAYVTRVGQLSTVIDVWELDDFNHMNLGMQALATHPDFPSIQAVLQDAVIQETLSFADKLVYPL